MAVSTEVSADFPHLFSPGRIGSLELRNRIVMTPMGTNQERDDGHLGEAIIRYYEARARGGAAMIIAGVASIMWPHGASNPNQAAISDDVFLSDWRELAARVHAHGARLAVQLHHGSKVAVQDIAAGRPLWVPSKRPLKGGDLYDNLTPEELTDATSALMQPGAGLSFHEMTHEDIATVVDHYAAAADRAKRAGVDGVELHAGHGYMLQAFLSPASNLRDDEYGGAIENRARMLVETIHAVRDRVGADYPVWCRIDGAELGIDGGITPDDAQRTAEIATDAGLDAVHVSAYANPTLGAAFTVAPLVHETAGYLDLAAGVKARITVPVIAVGRLEPERGEQALADGHADFIAMGRKLLADPDLPNKLLSGNGEDVRPCLYSYSCVGNVFLRRAARCTVNAWMGREGEAELELQPAATPRDIVVVGGGPTGLETARIAAARGHRVRLFEKNDRLGGLGRLAARVSDDTRRWIEYLVGQVENADIEVSLGTYIDAEALGQLAPDAAVVAVGGVRCVPVLEGADVEDAPAVLGLDNLGELLGRSLDGRRIVLVGDDMIAFSVAEHLAGNGAAVTLLGPGAYWAPEMATPRRWRLLDRLRRAGAELALETQVDHLSSGALNTSDAVRIETDTVVVIERAQPSAIAVALSRAVSQVEIVGDSNGPRYLQEGLLEAARIATAL
jgi:2,4-dienoyl-CoA reductase (NADPH2)